LPNKWKVPLRRSRGRGIGGLEGKERCGSSSQRQRCRVRPRKGETDIGDSGDSAKGRISLIQNTTHRLKRTFRRGGANQPPKIMRGRGDVARLRRRENREDPPRKKGRPERTRSGKKKKDSAYMGGVASAPCTNAFSRRIDTLV